MSRLGLIIQRYGWRALFVVPAIAAARAGWVWSAFRLNRLRLTTAGYKGRGVHFGRHISVTPGGHLDLGDQSYVGDRCVFEVNVNSSARVSVGSNAWISHDCHVMSYGAVDIGDHVLIGEFVSLRDTTHNFADPTIPIRSQQDIVGSIVIEDDVWIGRGALILGRPAGTVIGRGAVIGANSVVTQSVPPFAVVAGAPARLIRMRTDSLRSQG
jgi:acetyltransferase-like isoleucine patch superfamily enzyme